MPSATLNAAYSANVNSANARFEGESTLKLLKQSSITHSQFYYVGFDVGQFDSTDKVVTQIELSYTEASVEYGGSNSPVYYEVYLLKGDIDYDTVTQATTPTSERPFTVQSVVRDTSNKRVDLSTSDPTYISHALQHGNFQFFPFTLSDTASANLYLDGILSDAPPRLRIEYHITRPNVTLVSPKWTGVDGTQAITFEWIYDGYEDQAGYDLQYSLDGGATWTTFGSGAGKNTSHIIEPNIVPSGAVSWRVVATSSSGYTGVSDSANIVVHAPPVISNISVTTKPQARISWNSLGQEGYQIKVDGIYNSDTIFGKSLSHHIPALMPDGEHVVSVRVQNRLGIWSGWIETTVTTANSPSNAITLTAVSNSPSAELSWSDASCKEYWIYRDAIRIGATTDVSYTDIYASAGEHDYFVRGLDAEGNYTDSATQTLTVAVPDPVITDAGQYAGNWISLALGPDAERAVDVSYAQDISFRHYVGLTFPAAETSGYKNCSISFNVSFKDCSSQTAFKNLLGCEVCYKSGKLVLHGVLASMSMHHTRGFGSCSCTITAINEVIM